MSSPLTGLPSHSQRMTGLLTDTDDQGYLLLLAKGGVEACTVLMIRVTMIEIFMTILVVCSHISVVSRVMITTALAMDL